MLVSTSSCSVYCQTPCPCSTCCCPCVHCCIRYQYRDPITDFLQCLYVDFDFDGAQQKLRECAVVLKNDYFLDSLQEKFMDKARRFIFET
jgi:hypothetical protein